MSESFQNKDSDSERVAIVGMAWVEAESPDLASFWNSLIKAPHRHLPTGRLPGDGDLSCAAGLADKAVADALLDAHLDAASCEPRRIEVIAVEDCPTPSTSNALKEAVRGLMDLKSEAVVVRALIGLNESSERSAFATGGGMAIVLTRFSEAVAKGERIYACFGNELCSEVSTVGLDDLVAGKDVSQNTEDCIYLTCELDRPGDALKSVIKSALALYHRILPPGVSVGHVSTPERVARYRELFFNSQTRPWIHPSAHPELVALKPEIGESQRPRQAFIAEAPTHTGNLPLIIEEALDDYFTIHPTLHTSCETELFAFAGDSSADLMASVKEFRNFLLSGTLYSLKDIAYSLNCNEEVQGQNRIDDGLRIAIVAGTIEDLIERVELAIECMQEGIPAGYEASLADQGVYFGGNNEKLQSGKLAFLLPGLGSAYPNMLSELCIYFPEVRLIFDFVDYLAQDAGSSELPSDKIFPKPASGMTNASGSATADLVAMDAAVVTVLLAEWALFTLLLKLEIVPDVLVGCSTGEFAALSMGGAANILTSSPMFYRLSTDVANSLPKERLAQLRSIKVKAPLESFTAHLQKYDKKVFLSADLSDEQVILTGDKISIARLVTALEKSGFEVDYLPVAIPYHTALVAGAVTTDHAEVESVEMQAPEIPSWSCSIASEYPPDADAIKHITTELFSQPIRFKKTIQRLYEDAGVTKFVEVGPKDVLTPIVTEILSSQPHVAVSSNRATGSAVSHLNHALAQLYCCGVAMNLDYLYSRRSPKRTEFRTVFKETVAISPVETEQRAIALEIKQPDEISIAPTISAKAHGVVQTYLAELAEVHQSLMSAQQAIMAAYLDHKGSEPASLRSDELAQYFPLLNGCSIAQQGHTYQIEVPLNLDWHQYLLDHAIGGAIRTIGVSERVCLLPLTVALEMMAEAAACLYPELKVVELQEIRAFKRIRVGAEGFAIRISATPRSGDEATVEVAIQRPNLEAENIDVEAETLMSCLVLLGSSEAKRAPDAPLPHMSWNKSKFEKRPLYGIDAMFHGPRMQSVKRVEGISGSRIYGSLEVRNASDWFPTTAGQPNFVLDPLLLDNSTQLVLYHLFERDEPVDALLPFMIDSLRILQERIPAEGEVTVWVEMNSVTARGTDADVYVIASHGQLIAKFESIKSRRIVLADDWRKFIYDPARSYLSRPAAAIVGSFPDTSDRIYRFIDDSALPQDDATLNWCADYALSPQESRVFETLANSKRKREWLLGRIAAKDSVRLILANSFNRQFTCADIEILNDASGAPEVYISDKRLSLPKIGISITHKDGFAVAVALRNDREQRIGIDVEKIESREDGLEDLLLTDAERSILSEWLSRDRNVALSAAWSAKEAAAKALGTGLQANPKNFEIQSLEGPADKKGQLLQWTVSPLIEGQERNGEIRGKLPDPIAVSAEVTDEFVLSQCLLATATFA
jgi:malonyl CoA-acyl carrier protein transacylase/phosphopantetheinyl transferase (holo-ACP synthase)